MAIKGRCFTCWFSNWDYGGVCARPNPGYTRRIVVGQKSLNNLPAIRKLDYCGSHLTPEEYKAKYAPPVTGRTDDDEPEGDMLESPTILDLLKRRAS